MDPEEYEQERDYMIENWNEITKGSKGNYKPLWKQKVEEKAWIKFISINNLF